MANKNAYAQSGVDVEAGYEAHVGYQIRQARYYRSGLCGHVC